MTNTGYARIYPELNIDTLAFALAIELIGDQANHSEFPFEIHVDKFDEMCDAIGTDLHDLIHNGNQDDWLIYFFDTSEQPLTDEQADKLTDLLYLKNGYSEQFWRALNELVQKIATILLSFKAGVPGYVQMFPPEVPYTR